MGPAVSPPAPGSVRHDLFEPAYQDLRIASLLRRGGSRSSDTVRTLILFLECWRLVLKQAAAPKNWTRKREVIINAPPKERLSMFLNDFRRASGRFCASQLQHFYGNQAG